MAHVHRVYRDTPIFKVAKDVYRVTIDGVEWQAGSEHPLLQRIDDYMDKAATKARRDLKTQSITPELLDGMLKRAFNGGWKMRNRYREGLAETESAIICARERATFFDESEQPASNARRDSKRLTDRELSDLHSRFVVDAGHSFNQDAIISVLEELQDRRKLELHDLHSRKLTMAKGIMTFDPMMRNEYRGHEIVQIHRGYRTRIDGIDHARATLPELCKHIDTLLDRAQPAEPTPSLDRETFRKLMAEFLTSADSTSARNLHSSFEHMFGHSPKPSGKGMKTPDVSDERLSELIESFGTQFPDMSKALRELQRRRRV